MKRKPSDLGAPRHLLAPHTVAASRRGSAAPRWCVLAASVSIALASAVGSSAPPIAPHGQAATIDKTAGATGRASASTQSASADARLLVHTNLRYARTAAEISHSHLYDTYEQSFGRRTPLTAPATAASGNPFVEIFYERGVYSDAAGLYADPQGRGFAACHADAIITGTITTVTPLFTTNARLIFTDYGTTIRSVVKNDRHQHLALGQSTTVTQIGGSGELPDGRIAKALIDAYPPLAAGHSYLLLLKYLPNTRDYAPVNADSETDLTPPGASEQASTFEARLTSGVTALAGGACR